MAQYVGISASGHARQHNGDVYNDCTITHIHPEDQPSDLRLRCLRSLAFPHMEKRGDITAKAEKTCEWIYDDPGYKDWARSGGLLWIKGRAGTGKSTIMESLVTQKRTDLEHQSIQHETPLDTLVASFFFHRRGDSLQRTTVGLFRSLLHQIFRQDEELLSEFMRVTRFDQRCKNEGEVGVKWDWTASDLRENLADCVVNYAKNRPIILYVDALDESGEATARDLMDYFHRLRSSSTSGHLSICISCRPYPDVAWDWNYCVVVESGNADDINTFLHTNLRPAVNSVDQATLDQIRSELARRASGVFQWVVLVTRRVSSLRGESIATILAEIEKIPIELSDLYATMLDQLNDSDKILALPLLRWITFASRPLSLTELRYAVSIDQRKDVRSQLDFESSRHWCGDDELMTQRVLRLSQGLVSVVKDEDDEAMVQFDHESVQDYMSTRGIAFLEKGSQVPSPSEILGTSHHYLTRVCICRLRAFDVVEARVEKLMDRDWYSTAMPFVRYATDHWMKHAQIAEACGTSQADLIELTEWPSNSFWSRWSVMLGNPNYNHAHKGHTTLQHVAARYGLCSILKQLIPLTKKSTLDFLARSSKYRRWHANATHPNDHNKRTPLFWAATAGHNEAVRLLLAAGASIDPRDSCGNTPLMIAAINGYGSVVRILLNAGADVSMKDYQGQKLLAIAARYGNESVVRQLLARNDTKVEARDDHGETALHEAASNGDVTILELLLATGKADPDGRNADGATPLLCAASKGSEAITKLLLSTDKVDFNARDKFLGTPLLYAAYYGYEAVVKLLLETNKVDVNARDDLEQTPLSRAAERGHEAVVKLLLETNKVDVNARDGIKRTPLSYAAGQGHKTVVRLLLETNKVDVNARDDIERTPLSWAAWEGHKAIVRLLLETNKVDVNARDDIKRTPLSWAAWEGHEAVVRLLLSDDKVDVNPLDEYGRTPLCLAVLRNKEGVVRLLLSCGNVDIHARDCNGHTALDLARKQEKVYEGHSDYSFVVRLLEEAQERISSQAVRT